MLLFVAFPLVYTMWIGFTNYSSTHLLSQARVKAYLLEQTVPDEEHSLEFTLHPDGDALRLVLAPYEAASGAQRFVSPPLKLKGDKAETATMAALPADQALAPALSTRDVLAHRDALMALKLAMPDQRVLSLRRRARVRPVGRRLARQRRRLADAPGRQQDLRRRTTPKASTSPPTATACSPATR